jgi:hypothetical protein
MYRREIDKRNALKAQIRIPQIHWIFYIVDGQIENRDDHLNQC